jgi:hypothetical protein
MILKTLTGKDIHVTLSNCKFSKRKENDCKSKIQFRCGEELIRIFPRHIILEEFPIPKSRLRIDFFLPSLMIAVEVQGQQHFEFNPYFHNNMSDFIQSKKRDKEKAQWCEMNNIKLIYIKEGDSVRSKIADAIG